MSLFDPGTRHNAPDAATIAALAAFGRDPKKVADWTTARAKTVLAALQKEAAVVARRQRAADREATEPPLPGRGQPLPMERAAAAEYLAEAELAGIDNLHVALVSSMYALTDDETRRLAGYVWKLFRGPVAAPQPNEEGNRGDQ